MADELKGLKAAVLATDGFEQAELTQPVQALRGAGATVHVVAPKAGTIQGWRHLDKGDEVPVDATLDEADPDGCDALVCRAASSTPTSSVWCPKRSTSSARSSPRASRSPPSATIPGR